MDTSQVKSELQKGLKAFKAFENAAEVLTVLESLEGSVKETEVRLAVLKAQESDILCLKKEAQEEAATIKADAKEKADDAMRDAASKARKMMDDAKRNAAKLIDDAMAEAKTLSEDSNDLRDRNSAASLQLSIAKKELVEIQAALIEHKAAIAKFLKG